MTGQHAHGWRVGLALLVLVTTAAAAAPAVTLAPLAAHRATYDLTLQSVHGEATVAASGSMTYQVSDDCTGWATQQQLRLHTVSRDGGAVDLVSDYATLESKDGRHLSFDMKQRSNGVITLQLRGEAAIAANGSGRIRYSLPRQTIVNLPAGTLFPMAHTQAIIRAARAGRKSIAPTLFDGTGLDGAQDTYVTIIGWYPPPASDGAPGLAALGSSRVHVAFFARRPDVMIPDYESAMRYYDNGIADQLVMDFGDFTMRGALRTLALPKHPASC